MRPIRDECVFTGRPRVVVDSTPDHFPDLGEYVRTYVLNAEVPKGLRNKQFSSEAIEDDLQVDECLLLDALRAVPGTERITFGRHTITLASARSFGPRTTVPRALDALCRVFEESTELGIVCYGDFAETDTMIIDEMSRDRKRDVRETGYRSFAVADIKRYVTEAVATEA